MTTHYYTHNSCVLHDMGYGHPESPARLKAIDTAVRSIDWDGKVRFLEAPALDFQSLESVHPHHHVEAILELSPSEGLAYVDGDTVLCPDSIEAARRAAGAAIQATDDVIKGVAKNAFCAIRPPGHHAESTIAMGFCLFNNVALAAESALAKGIERVAILDFDVHHGNGTVEIFQDRPEVLVCSSFQYPFYPGRFDRVNKPNICLTPLSAGTGSSEFRSAIERDWNRALDKHQAEILFISAGFDAHRDDPLGGLRLIDEDYLWVSQFICDQAAKTANGRIVSMLEGGYDLNALARCSLLHLQALAAT